MLNVRAPSATSNGGYFSQIINVYKPKGNRGPSDFDVRHAITGNLVADLPFGRGKIIGNGMNGLADSIVGGWKLTGLTHWTSGLPFSSVDGLGWGTTGPTKAGTWPQARSLQADTNTIAVDNRTHSRAKPLPSPICAHRIRAK
jgi:hypothetical protein